MSTPDPRDMSLFDLFRQEARTHAQAISDGLLALEHAPADAARAQACMRAAHSLKGAARVVGLDAGVRLTHAMEDCFVAVQQGRLQLRQAHIDVLLRGVDLLLRLAEVSEADSADWVRARQGQIDTFLRELADVLAGTDAPVAPAPPPGPVTDAPARPAEPAVRVVRLASDSLNRLLGLAGEAVLEAQGVKAFAATLLRLKRLQQDKLRACEDLAARLAPDREAAVAVALLRERLQAGQQLLASHLDQIEQYERRSFELSHRLYDEALACRMGPFAEGTQSFARQVRDVARALDKKVRFTLEGEATLVDRDLLDRLEAPLGHLLRNAVDHGIEPPALRVAAGKPPEGSIRLAAHHSAGLLLVSVSDDGAGIDLEQLRARVVRRELASAETVAGMTPAELFEFLFLPGFTLREAVTDISGRGVGLDAVREMVRQVRGTVRVSSEPGRGTQFQIRLPLTLSVLRALVARIGGQPYALPLARIERVLTLTREHIEQTEGRQHFRLGQRQIGLVGAHQALGLGGDVEPGDELCVVVLGDEREQYGLIVDRLLGERELVVQPLDERLGKLPNIAAGALLEDGMPVPIVDVEDLLRAIGKLVAGGQLSRVGAQAGVVEARRGKRVLVIDDSLTVRELERKLLGSHGYEVEVAVDGMDGWNAVRAQPFDLVVTDIDMPRMDGIELVTLIKKHPHLRQLPVLVVSYKDREEDRQRGLEAGADYYLAKGSFHDEALLQAVADLIGEAMA